MKKIKMSQKYRDITKIELLWKYSNTESPRDMAMIELYQKSINVKQPRDWQ